MGRTPGRRRLSLLLAGAFISVAVAAACSRAPEPSGARETGPATAAQSAAPHGGSSIAAAAGADRRPSPGLVRRWPVPDSAPGGEPFGAGLVAQMELALQAKPPGYLPRTRHLSGDGAPLFTNRLVLEASPYLQQHAHNPVDWRPWGDEAFAEARRLGRPVFLSIGYSTCHWCHVMERESFEDIEIATYLNSHFVAIKVDREERPDVDAVYMAAVQMLTGAGGWPMTLALTPERKPFFGGTYFPARDGDRGASKGLATVLRELVALYDGDRNRVVERASQISARLQAGQTPPAPAGLPAPRELFARVSASLSSGYDRKWGGFGAAPKFPRPATLEFLMRYYRRSGEREAREMVEGTLAAMAAGGIHDHLGGGFHRYSVDSRWLLPHFEKMLYDNAQLACVYLDAYQIGGREDFARVARDTLDYVAREMTDPAGGFYSATDADSAAAEGGEEEGAFFTWTAAEVREVLGAEDAALIGRWFGISDTGNFAGRNVLHTWTPLAKVAADAGLTAEAAQAKIAAATAQLYRARQARPRPATDTKVLAAWNGLMISAFARGARVLRDPRYARIADAAADFVLREMTRDGGLLRSWTAAGARHAAVLDDYAYFIAGLLDLFEATSDPRRLEQAVALERVLERDFGDGDGGGFFFTAAASEPLLLREKPYYDGARPSGNAVALCNLVRLHELTLSEHYREAAAKLLSAFAPMIAGRAQALPAMLSGLDAYTDFVKEIVIVKPQADADAGVFLDRLARVYLPDKVVAVVEEGGAERMQALAPWVEGKVAIGGKVTAYVCEQHLCKRPATDPDTFSAQIATVHPYGAEQP